MIGSFFVVLFSILMKSRGDIRNAKCACKYAHFLTIIWKQKTITQFTTNLVSTSLDRVIIGQVKIMACRLSYAKP